MIGNEDNLHSENGYQFELTEESKSLLRHKIEDDMFANQFKDASLDINTNNDDLVLPNKVIADENDL